MDEDKQSIQAIIEEVERARDEALQRVAAAAATRDLEDIRLHYLGRRGVLGTILRGLGGLAPEDRPRAGEAANKAREEVGEALAQRAAALQEQERRQRWQAEAVDVTMPGRPVAHGHRHPLWIVLEEIEDIFLSMGYHIAHGPEVEYEYYNFEALNYPPDHPAKDMQDSFFITPRILLRTHTSPVQIRHMQEQAPRLPIRIIAPGRVFRRDDDATHSPMFHQVEGLLVDRDISMADLKGTLLTFLQRLFGPQTKIRLRPSYFPFTEPSAEVDASCPQCHGDGCRVCGHSGWLELLGCGMVHPQVLRNGGYDPEEVSGFAFGMGLERITMIKFGIHDLRLLFQNDLRFLRQLD